LREPEGRGRGKGKGKGKGKGRELSHLQVAPNPSRLERSPLETPHLRLPLVGDSLVPVARVRRRVARRVRLPRVARVGGFAVVTVVGAALAGGITESVRSSIEGPRHHGHPSLFRFASVRFFGGDMTASCAGCLARCKRRCEHARAYNAERTVTGEPRPTQPAGWRYGRRTRCKGIGARHAAERAPLFGEANVARARGTGKKASAHPPSVRPVASAGRA
jgi:hypothetical protein